LEILERKKTEDCGHENSRVILGVRNSCDINIEIGFINNELDDGANDGKQKNEKEGNAEWDHDYLRDDEPSFSIKGCRRGRWKGLFSWVVIEGSSMYWNSTGADSQL
jgi:hypothetical protein